MKLLMKKLNEGIKRLKINYTKTKQSGQKNGIGQGISLYLRKW